MRRSLSATLAVAGLGALFVTCGLTRLFEPRPPIPPLETRPNPFGVILSFREMPISLRLDVARGLGVTYFRTSPALTREPSVRCDECSLVDEAGLRLVLTVANRSEISKPATPPADLDTYRATIERTVLTYRPALLVVENEENAGKYWRGTVDEYGEELRIACEVAHANGVPCTNGGLQSPSLAVLVYQSYVDQAKAAKAEDFARRAFEPHQLPLLGSSDGRSRIRNQAERLQDFLRVYRTAGMDYVNFHWYIGDAPALREATEYLREVTGLQPISNEFGQRSDDPAVTERLLAEIVDLALPYVVWFSSDTIARSLVNTDGTLRPTGSAMRAFLEERYGSDGASSAPA